MIDGEEEIDNNVDTFDNVSINQSKMLATSPIHQPIPILKQHNNTQAVNTLPTESSSTIHSTYEGKGKLSFMRMFCMFSVSFSYGMAFSSINSIIIPKEIGRLTTRRQSIWVGLLMACGAVSQLATPIVGSLSDRRGPASRTQFLIYGAVLTVLGVSGFSIVASFSSLLMLLGTLILTTIGLSVQYSMTTALLTDHVSEEQMGLGSGIMAVQGMLGSGTGYMLFALNLDLHVSYTAYIIATITCTVLTCLFTPTVRAPDSRFGSRGDEAMDDEEISVDINGEILGSDRCTPQHIQQPTMRGKKQNNVGRYWLVPHSNRQKKSSDTLMVSGSGSYSYIPSQLPIGSHMFSGKFNNKGHIVDMKKKAKRLKRLATNTFNKAAYEVAIPFCQLLAESLVLPRHSENPDFFYACLGRAFFNIGLAGQLFFVYYLKDVMKAKNPLQLTSVIAMLALFGGLLGALPAGRLSDIIGKKPLIYVSIGFCVSSLVLFMLVSDLQVVQLVGFIYGIGNVAYLSVDYALGVQTLPKRLVTEKNVWRCRNQQCCDAINGVHLSEEAKSPNTEGVSSAFIDKNHVSHLESSQHHDSEDQMRSLSHNTGDTIPSSNANCDNIDLLGGKDDVEIQTNDAPCHHVHLLDNAIHNDINNESLADGINIEAKGELRQQSGKEVYNIGQYNDNPHHNSYCDDHRGDNDQPMIDCYNTYYTTTTTYKPTDAARDLGVFAMSATFGQMIGQIIYGTVLNLFGINVIYQFGGDIGAGGNMGPVADTSNSNINTALSAGTLQMMRYNNIRHTLMPTTGGTNNSNLVEMTVYTQGGFIVIYSIASLAFILSGVATYFVRDVR